MATDAVEALYRLPLDEFTAARNRLAADLRKAGKGGEAAQVKGLEKPSVSAWVANQLFWRHRKAFDRLMAGGEALRRAQAAQLSGKAADVRAPLEARRDALADLSRAAAEVLASASHPASPDMMRRITATLEAISAYGTGPAAPAPGRLTRDVDPPGFDTLAALVPAGAGAGAPAARRGSGAVLPFTATRAHRESGRPARSSAVHEARRDGDEEKARRAAEKAALQHAERELRDARAAAERSRAAAGKIASRVAAAEDARREAEARLEALTEELASLRQQARQAAADAERADQLVADAERVKRGLMH